MGNHQSAGPQPLGHGRFGDVHTRRSERVPRRMDRLRRSLRDSLRRRKQPESSRPHLWQEDESAVRAGTCTFAVKYLGCVEVFESRGMQVCEEALKVLRGSRRRPVRAVLLVSGDGLRVVEDDTKGLIVDQTIEKVSFCAPDRNHERGFSYICRDGTTRRWMCHGFLAARETGERLSHAVGCAFAACLERKQRRDKECGVTMSFDAKSSTFTRTGSFRQPEMTEMLMQKEEKNSYHRPPQPHSNANANSNSNSNPYAIERPHAAPGLFERQGSFRAFGQLANSSPFKRQMSLRINDLPSNAERLRAFRTPPSQPSVSPIPELMAADPVAAMCQQFSQCLNQLARQGSDDLNFNSQLSVNQNTTVTVSTTLTNNPSSITSSGGLSPLQLTPISNSSLLQQSSPLTLQDTSSVNRSLGSDGPPVVSLPQPEQWLGQIARSASPLRPEGGSPRRAPLLGAAPHSRALSLDSAGESRGLDPFDADWAAPVESTNPFLAPKAHTQPFQVK